jgi:hypothetical protein
VRARLPWGWVVLAVALTVLAVVASRDYAVAVPAAAASAAVGVLAVVDSIRRLGSRRPSAAPTAAAPASAVRGWIASGSLGREELVLLLDRLDRQRAHPTLPIRSPKEIAELVRMSRPEFRTYLQRRVAAIEELR